MFKTVVQKYCLLNPTVRNFEHLQVVDSTETTSQVSSLCALTVRPSKPPPREAPRRRTASRAVQRWRTRSDFNFPAVFSRWFFFLLSFFFRVFPAGIGFEFGVASASVALCGSGGVGDLRGGVGAVGGRRRLRAPQEVVPTVLLGLWKNILGK